MISFVFLLSDIVNVSLAQIIASMSYYKCYIIFSFVIAAKPKMKSHYRGHKMALWLNLIPQLHQPGNEDVSMRHHHFHEREQHYYAGTYSKHYPFSAIMQRSAK